MTTAPAVALPSDLQRLLEAVDAAGRRADALGDTLSEAQFRWQPDGGTRWSVAQCLEHLATTNEVYAAAIRGAVDAALQKGWTPRGPLAPGPLGRRFVSSLEPPVTFRARSPKRIIPGSTLTRAEILERFHAAHEIVKGCIRDAARTDANRATFRNPFFRLFRVKVSTGLQVVAAHDRRHLWQAEGVTTREDFPKR